MCCSVVITQANGSITDTTSRNTFTLNPPDAGVNQMDSLIEALFSTNPAWEFNAADYAADNMNPFDTVRFSPEIYRERIANISTSIPLTYNDQVQAFINLYTVKSVARYLKCLHLVSNIFQCSKKNLIAMVCRWN